MQRFHNLISFLIYFEALTFLGGCFFLRDVGTMTQRRNPLYTPQYQNKNRLPPKK